MKTFVSMFARAALSTGYISAWSKIHFCSPQSLIKLNTTVYSTEISKTYFIKILEPWFAIFAGTFCHARELSQLLCFRTVLISCASNNWPDYLNNSIRFFKISISSALPTRLTLCEGSSNFCLLFSYKIFKILKIDINERFWTFKWTILDW